MSDTVSGLENPLNMISTRAGVERWIEVAMVVVFVSAFVSVNELIVRGVKSKRESLTSP